ncbi:hypothetical protein [Actinoalloteichus sp. GBA129-24]|uniref:hypothetical protein n=1 Tax=Actinoalloteichus sp. GBA129-24 TaxID=1612551 RepID=UPI0012F72EDF|nr:hypothetical protein [Actinoalloteichus sp. GBA129-24]
MTGEWGSAYRELTPEAEEIFRLVSVLALPDVDVALVAAVAAISEMDTRQALDELYARCC